MTNKATPKVSIVIVNFNYGEYLQKAIDSALAVGSSAETIVVDDGSTDVSRSLIATYGDRIFPILQENSGACAARNAGLAVARAPYVKFLDADDWLADGAVARQLIQVASIGQTKAAVFGDVVWVSDDEKPLSGQCSKSGVSDKFELPRFVDGPPLTTAPLHRREDVIRVGGFDPRVRRGQEHDLHVRLAISGVVFHYRPGPVYFYRQHRRPGRISSSDASAGKSVLAASRRHIAAAHEAGLMTPDLAKAFAHRLWRQGRETLQRGSPDIARAFFAEAYALYPSEPTPGSQVYRNLNRLVGPVAAERLSSIRRLLREIVRN